MLFIDKLNQWIGERVSWLTLGLVLVICIDVLLRYLFNFSQNWILDLEWHFFSLIFLLGSGYALQADKHVRVDVFYAKYKKSSQALLNIFGHLLFLIPWCLLILYTSYNYAMNSWAIQEGSAEPGGLHGRYVIKFAIVLGFVLLLLQGISQIIKDIKSLKQEL